MHLRSFSLWPSSTVAPDRAFSPPLAFYDVILTALDVLSMVPVQHGRKIMSAHRKRKKV
jgi:hypothetical protein